MNKRIMGLLCAGVVFLSLVSTAEAALVGRLPATPGGTDYQAVYDIDRDITWLADANLAATTTFGVPDISANGRMSWFTANSWIGSLNATTQHGGVGFLGFTDWRLPSAFNQNGSGPCGTGVPAVNCTDSELGHLFYDKLGGNANESVFTQTGDTSTEIANLELFSNVQAFYYWSGTEFVPNPFRAWDFLFQDGNQSTDPKFSPFIHVWAVRDGDVAPIPTPSAMLLMGSGLVALIGWKYRRKKKS